MPSVTLTMPSSGAISLNDALTVYGSANMSELYRGGSRVPNTSPNSNIPTSGTISLNQFYGGQNPFNAPDLTDLYVMDITGTPSGTLTVSTAPARSNGPCALRWNFTGGGVSNIGSATNTWFERAQNAGISCALSGSNFTFGGDRELSGTITVDWALPGRTVAVFSQTINWAMNWGGL